ncbi:MAG: ATP-binding protein [Deltaproteobacteria bacterium]|nr:ATP-binding protein [Deltaproteobacteria bacterium]
MYWRYLSDHIRQWSEKNYVQILFGARQTGKSTLLRSVFRDAALWIDLSDPAERTRYLAQPGAFSAECRALPTSDGPLTVVVDEAQTVPEIFNAVQSLYDGDPGRWRFVLCGSSSRKLRQSGANLLPGRSVYHHLHALTLSERPAAGALKEPGRIASLPDAQAPTSDSFPRVDLETRLAFGELPGIATAAETDRAKLLSSYTQIYLEEEIRREALVRDWGAFARFLPLAAAESGSEVNFSAVSRQAGVSVPTVKSYYALLEDMFIGFQVCAFSKSPRKYLLSTPRFYFFDLGVRHAAAGLEPGLPLVRTQPGKFFEQWVIQELWKRLGYLGRGCMYHYRTKGGVEIDCIIELDGVLTPIEIKWTERPDRHDVRHLIDFVRDHAPACTGGYLVCRCARPMQLDDNVVALPYQCL